MKILVLLAVTVPAFGQVAITLQPADHAAIPGSSRSLYADVEGTPNLTVKWTATGGCTLASPTTTAAPQIVTAPAKGSSCSINPEVPTNTTPSFTSAVSCTITAASAADESKTAAMVIPVCAPRVMLSTFPRTTVLYKNQFAVIQSNLRGSMDTGVTWTITTNPGNAGKLTDGASNRHAIFSATGAGTYTLTATSVADPTKKASTAIFVTAHDLPAPNTDHTESVDCTAVGSGKTYEVGPERAFHDLDAVPWPTLKPGDTVRVHNDDTTGSSPTIYRQHVSIAASGSATQPIRVCGVPDDKGVKPVIDGDKSTTRPDENWAGGILEGLGVVTVYDAAHKYDGRVDGVQNVIIEGLHIRDGNATFSYMSQKTGTITPFNPHAACVRVQTGFDIFIRGNDVENCDNGIFSNAQTPEGSMVYDLTVQGNYLHGWGLAKNYGVHAMYLQSIGLTVQFNYFGTSTPEALGNLIKTRAVLNFLRWNYISQPLVQTARAFDMIEPQAFSCYIMPYTFAYVYHGGRSSDCNTPHDGVKADPLTADEVAANFEAYHSDYVYGNIMDDSGSDVAFVHYGYDIQVTEAPAYMRRGGTLYYWNNTHLMRRPGGEKMIFDPVAPDTKGHSYEFPVVQSFNNVFGTTGTTAIHWTRSFWSQIVVDSNWISTTSILPSRNSGDVYQGGSSIEGCNQYGMCKPGNGHLMWARNGKFGPAAAMLYTGPTPFNTETFMPTDKIRGLAAQLPSAIRDQPSNMQYLPKTNTIVPRKDLTFLGALD